MKVKVNIPCRPTRVYTDDFDEVTIPNVGDEFDDTYIIIRKTIEDDTCILDVKRKDKQIKE